MSFRGKRELLVQVAPRYCSSRHGQRIGHPDEFVAVTGYERKYAIRLLLEPIRPPAPIRRPRAARYGPDVQQALSVVCQPLTLPLITRVLRIGGDDLEERQELHARAVAAHAVGGRIDELAAQWPEHLPLIDTLRLQYEHRATHLDEERDGDSPDGMPHSLGAEQELLEHPLIRRALIDAERNAVLQLRQHGEINDEV